MNVALFEAISQFPVMQGSTVCVVQLGFTTTHDLWSAIITPHGADIRRANKLETPSDVEHIAAPNLAEPDLKACYYAGALLHFVRAHEIITNQIARRPNCKSPRSPFCIVRRCVAFCEGSKHLLFSNVNCQLVHGSATSIAYVMGDHFIEFVFLADAARVVYRCKDRSQTASFMYPRGLDCRADGTWSTPDKEKNSRALVEIVEHCLRLELSSFPVFTATNARRAYTVQCQAVLISKAAESP